MGMLIMRDRNDNRTPFAGVHGRLPWHLSSALGLLLAPLLAGCIYLPPERFVPEYDLALVQGVSIFGEEVRAEETPSFDILDTTPEMRAFLEDVRTADLRSARYTRLVNKLRKEGYFDDTYDAGITSTAAQTFSDKRGNCIAYTNMFVALARAADLNARFQLALSRVPTWTVSNGMLVRNNHVNVYVEGSRVDGGRGHTIDFNMIEPDQEAKSKLISDSYATSLFYANLSVDELDRGNDRRAFSFLRRAIDVAPENADLWINLGAMYSSHEQHDLALEAFTIARELRPLEKAALSSMERAHRALGNIEVADQLARKVRRYRFSNPYYHFAVAQLAYEDGAFSESLESIDRAIKLRKRNPRFHFLKALSLYRLGDHDGARENFAKAKRFGRYDDLWLRYAGDRALVDLTG
jgi:tetratricopeptide (TPR) repeat protein